jgi:GAF domain-containing protein
MAVRSGARDRDVTVAAVDATADVRPLAPSPSLADLIARIVLDAAGEDELSEILSATLHRLRGLVPFTGGSIALVESDELVVRAAIGPFAELALQQRLPKNESASWQVVRSREPRLIVDLPAAGVRVHGTAAGATLRSWLAAPLVRKGRAIGLLEVDSTEPNAFDDGHLAILRAVATALSGPVEIVDRYRVESQALQASEVAQARLAFLADAGAILASSLDLEATLTSVARLAVPRVADWCAIDMLDESDRPRLVTVSHVDPDRARWAATLRERYPIDLDAPSGLGFVLRTGESSLVPEIPDEMIVQAVGDDAERQRILDGLGPLRSLMIVALREGERTIGAISFVSTESGRRFDPEDLRLAEDLARRVSSAVSRARLYREASEARRAAEEAARRSSQLLGITAELSTAVTREDVARVIVDRGVAGLRAAAGSLALISADQSTLEVVASRGYAADLLERYGRLPLDSPMPLAVAARSGETVWLNGLEAAVERFPDLSEALERARRDGRRALAAIPLRSGDRPIGAIGLSFDEPRDQTEAETEFLAALAHQCSQALERARLYEAERDARELAETIQASLRARERQQAGVAALGERATGGPSLGALFRDAADTIVRTLDVEFVEILELLPGGQKLRLAAGAGWRKGFIGRAVLPTGADSQAGYTLLTHGPVVVDDLASEARFRAPRLLRAHGVVSGLTVPIGRPAAGSWGVLGAMTSRRASFTPDDVNFVLAVANMLAAAIDRDHAAAERDRLLQVEREAQLRREAFIGVMSHELRTPITTIYAGAKYLSRKGRGAARRQQRDEVLADLQTESERLYRLVEDLLVITRVERGVVEPAGEPLLLQRILPRLAAAAQVSSPGLRVEIDAPESLPTVRGEETYVEQVIRNLFSNARKYSPPGATVRLVAEPTDREVIVRVLDQGPGFPPGEGARLFELFYRSPGTAEKAAGAGIGLFVCKQLVEAMGGRVWAAPRPVRGAEFGFTLPRITDDEFA